MVEHLVPILWAEGTGRRVRVGVRSADTLGARAGGCP